MPTTASILRVLVVEDAEFQRLMIEQALRSLGVQQIHGASNGAEALRVLRSSPGIDLLVMDVVMPEVDGIELIPKLREAACGASLVFVSSEQWTLDISAEIARSQGLTVLGTIGKPVTPQKLQAVLDLHLSRHSGPRVT